LRADYCGDGKGHTVNGTLVNVWDNWGIEREDLEVDWPLEAEWTSDGAKCVPHVRLTTDGDAGVQAAENYIASHCARVTSPSALSTCGSSLSTFNTIPGYLTPINERVFLRNESEAPSAD
jgi:hypothetical protein